MQKIYAYIIYMKKIPKHDERKFEQMGKHTMFLDKDIQHHEKSILLELIYEFNTISVKKKYQLNFFFGGGQGYYTS